WYCGKTELVNAMPHRRRSGFPAERRLELRRRDLLAAALTAGCPGFPGSRQGAAQDSRLRFLCPPDGMAPDLSRPSPPSRPFAAPLPVMPIKQPVKELNPLPDPAAHQLWDQHKPVKFYSMYEQEFR